MIDWNAWAMRAKTSPTEAREFIAANSPAVRHLARKYRYGRNWKASLETTREALDRALATYDSGRGAWLPYWELWARNYAQRDIAEAIARDGVALACSVDACSAEAHDPEVDIYRAEMSALLHAAIAALGYHQREAIRLYLDGHTYEQIGVIMAVSRQSARIRVSQAVERITKKLRREI